MPVFAKCSVCGEMFKQPPRQKSTCSRICASKKNPPIRQPRKIRKGDVRGDADFSLVYRCKCCGKYFRNKITKYCEICQPNIRLYRARCEFKFNVFDYPDKFNLDLVNEFGWYSPGGKKGHKTKNTNGVARDHLYTVADGFKNGVEPEMLAHPANCQLILQEDNVRKRDTSTITLEELKQRIANWNREA